MPSEMTFSRLNDKRIQDKHSSTFVNHNKNDKSQFKDYKFARKKERCLYQALPKNQNKLPFLHGRTKDYQLKAQNQSHGFTDSPLIETEGNHGIDNYMSTEMSISTLHNKNVKK